MTLEEAITMLDACDRRAVQEYAVLDVYWTRDGETVAHGYFAPDGREVLITNGRLFVDDDAATLAAYGQPVRSVRPEPVVPTLREYKRELKERAKRKRSRSGAGGAA